MVQAPGKVGRVAIYQSDAEGRCIFVNAALCELFGLSEKEAMGVGWLDRVHPEDRARVQAERRHAASAVPVFYLDYRTRTQRFVLGIISLGVGIPITAISANVVDPGLAGVLVSWAGIVGVNVAAGIGARRRTDQSR